MAEDTSCRNETTTLLLLESITKEWRNNGETYDSPGDLMRTCLLKAGVSYQGTDALHIHMAIFRDVFTKNESVSPCDRAKFGFCDRDYFEMLRDEELGWVSFLTKMLPYLRLQTANDFLGRLILCLKSFDGASQKLADIQLFLFALSLVHSIMLDWLLAARGGTDNTREMQDHVVDSLPLDGSHNDVQALATHLRTSLESLLQLCSVDKLSPLASHDRNLFEQLVGNNIIAAVVLNPYLTLSDASTLLLQSYVGQISIPDINKRRIDNRKNNDLSRSQTTTKCGTTFNNNLVWTDIFVKKQNCKCEKIQPETNMEKLSGVASTSDVKDKLSEFNIFINSLGFHIPTSLFVDLICWFCQSKVEYNKHLCNQLGDILFECKDITVGRHVLSGHILYPWFVKFQQDLVNGGRLVPVRLATDGAKIEDVIATCLWPDRMWNLSSFRMTQIGLILESRRGLAGQEDLALVSRAVLKKEGGWRDLLEMGLLNTDISGWWKAGFFQLVWDNEATLSTESNVRQVLQVLCRVGAEFHSSAADAEIRTSVYRLFGIMFKRLPTLLQEQVVLSVLTKSRHRGPDQDPSTGGLHHILSQQEVTDQLTSLLNRLTSAGVDKMVDHILFLCLFDAHGVVHKCLQVALENKAQVLPLVQVLRRMPGICRCSQPKSKQSILLFGLSEILSGTVICDRKADNIIHMLCLCTETYSLEVTVDPQTAITKNMPGLLSQSDVFQHFISPSLDSESSTAAPARQQLDQTSQHPDDQPKEDQDQHPTDSGGGTEVCRDEDVTEDESDSLGSGVAAQLPLDVSLRTISALLERVDILDIKALKPLPLLLILADMYARNCVVFTDGDLDKRMLLTKQACQKSITLLISAVWENCSLFTKAEFLWLKQRAIRRGWLCTAVLKPVLNIGCDVELHDILSSLASRLMLQTNQGGSGIRGLVVLIQLAIINDEMLSDVLSVFKQSQLSAGHNQLVLAVGCILASALAAEMHRLVDIIIMLLANQEKPLPADKNLPVPGASLRIQASELLTDAVLQLSTSELAAAPWCHIVSNYQAAEQELLQQEAPTFALLVDVFCHICTVLSATEGQAASILQVSAMDVLAKLKACAAAAAEDQSGGGRGDKGCVKVMSDVGSYVGCVCEESVRATLRAQLANV